MNVEFPAARRPRPRRGAGRGGRASRRNPAGGQASMAKTPKDVRKLAEDAGVKIVDLRFVDLPGVWQHFSLPVRDLSDDLFDRAEGIGFDGSSIRGYQQ